MEDLDSFFHFAFVGKVWTYSYQMTVFPYHIFGQIENSLAKKVAATAHVCNMVHDQALFQAPEFVSTLFSFGNLWRTPGKHRGNMRPNNLNPLKIATVQREMLRLLRSVPNHGVEIGPNRKACHGLSRGLLPGLPRHLQPFPHQTGLRNTGHTARIEAISCSTLKFALNRSIPMNLLAQ